MTVFRPKVPGERMGTRFWGPQLTRYAAYRMTDGSVMGDKANLALTEAVVDNGWVPPEPKGHFDVLPIVLETDAGEIRMFDVPPECAREVPLEHPHHPNFAKLGLKWGAVPSITNFTMNLGGIDYTACPFNGWFMNTELARDLMEDGRCGRSHDIAKSFGIKVSDTDPFWKDRTFLELNFAVVHSFRKDGASIVDHHTASQQFMTHDLREKREGRECPAQWSWIVPPLGGSLTQVFHHEMRHFNKDPRFVYQAEIYSVKRSTHSPVSSSAAKVGKAARKRVFVLYGSETGTAEGYAYQTADRLRAFACHVSPLDRVDLSELTAPDVHAVLVVMSTFGDGGMPNGAKGFYEKAKGLSPGALTGLRYSLMALGSSAYPEFCKAGKTMDALWQRLGATPLAKIQLGNELEGQAKSVRDWQSLLDPVLGVGPATAAVAGQIKGNEAEATGGVRFLDADCKEVKAAMKHKENFVRKGYTLCPLTSNEELLKPATAKRSTRLLEIDLSRHPKLTYFTGDHVSVLPSNNPVLVERILKWIGAKRSQWITVTGNGRVPFPVPTTVARAFVHELDMSTREPIAPLLNLVLQRASDDSDKRRLESLLEKEDKDCWANTETAFLNKHTTVLSILKEFPSAKLSAEDLIVTLPLMKPRHYSISSATEVQPRQIHLTVGVLKVANPSEKTTREGLCSHFLSRQKPGELIRVAVRSSDFRSPPDLSSCPVIMVGTGTGISPMVAFLRARAEALRQGATLAPCHVYFGCRDSTEVLYSEQLRQWGKDGVITALHVAMSREAPKAYVQHLIGQQQSSVWEMLSQPSCNTYICGDSSMGEEVKAEMMMVALRCSSMDRLGVIEYFKVMKTEGRLQSDTWGVGLHGTAAVDTFLSHQHAQGRWQSQVEAAKTLALAGSSSSSSKNDNSSNSNSGNDGTSRSSNNSSSRSSNSNSSINSTNRSSNSISNCNTTNPSETKPSNIVNENPIINLSDVNHNPNRSNGSNNNTANNTANSNSIPNNGNSSSNNNNNSNNDTANNNNSNSKAATALAPSGNSASGGTGPGGSLGRLASMARGVKTFRGFRRPPSSPSTATPSPRSPPSSAMTAGVGGREEEGAAGTAGLWGGAATE